MRVLGISTQLLHKHTNGDVNALERGENTRQLDTTYRDPTDTARVARGDRAPGSPLVDADGSTLRLFDLFRGPHETLPHFGPTAPSRHPHAVDLFHGPGRGGYVSPEAFTFYDATDGPNSWSDRTTTWDDATGALVRDGRPDTLRIAAAHRRAGHLSPRDSPRRLCTAYNRRQLRSQCTREPTQIQGGPGT